MPTTYTVTASITSGTFNVWLTVATHPITLAHDDSGCWAGTATLDLTSPAPIHFKAVGINTTPWTLTLKFTPNGGGACKTYSHSDTIPDDELTDFTDQTTLS